MPTSDRTDPNMRSVVPAARRRAKRTVRRLQTSSRRRWHFPIGVPNKVFCVGFNKTGTTSLAEFLKRLGLATAHDVEWASVTDVNDPLLTRFDAFTDGEQPDIQALDAAFPGSKFILNTRGLVAWLESRVRWVEQRQVGGGTGSMRREFEELGFEQAVIQWAERRDAYHRRVFEYFCRRPEDLLVVNVETEPDVAVRLTRFLRANPVRAPEIPHRNKSRVGPSDELASRIRETLLGAGYSEASLDAEIFASRTLE